MSPSVKYPRLISTTKGFSFFSFISYYWKAKESGWDRAFHRLCSLMRKMNVQNVFVEKINEHSADISEEIEALKKHYEQKIYTRAFKFTFLSEKVFSVSEIKGLSDDKFLASATLINFRSPKNNWSSYIQKAVVCRPRISDTPLLNNYIHVRRNFTCSVNINTDDVHNFKINGSFFCQQNGVTSVCAHASLCMLINNMDKRRRMISTEWINEILNIDHRTNKNLGQEGLNEKQVLNVLRRLGLKANWHNFFDYPNTDYAEYIYRFMEGGCPSLLVFTTKHDPNQNDIPMHVVPVIGHTLNSDIWDAEAELAYDKGEPLHYRSASKWVDHFIIHDDNFGMYLCLPVTSLRKITIPKRDPSLRAYLVISVTPEKIETPAREAEWAAALLIRNILAQLSTKVTLGVWLENLTDKRTPMVVRTLLLNKKHYKQHLISEKDFEDQHFTDDEANKLTRSLPDYFWLSEVSIPDLYTANKSKIVDIIYTCNQPTRENEPIDEKNIAKRWIQIRFPGACYFNKKSKKPIPLSVKSHFPLYRREKEIKGAEW
jgi:hypothetical protein